MHKESRLKGKKEKKVVMPLDISKRKQNIIYKAAMFKYKDFDKLEYQCSREELKVFKNLVIRVFVKDACEIMFKHKIENK